MKRFVPLAIFVVLAAFLWVGLYLNPREVPSPFIGKQMPVLKGIDLLEPARSFSHEDMRGQVWLLNFWATWCPPCREEHPLLVGLARTGQVPIIGVNFKDDEVRAAAWLKELGNPYGSTVTDKSGRLGIEFGVYGLPETFVIDAGGTIRYKFVGPLTPSILETKILPLVKELRQTAKRS